MKMDFFVFCFRREIASKKGFTFVELLLIIAIMSIMASIVLVNMGDAGGKANRSAFLEEVSAGLPGILTTCASENIDVTNIANTPNVRWIDVRLADHKCGSANREKTFCVRARNKNAFAKTSINGCNVSIDQSGTLFKDIGCATQFTSSDCL
jgi:prepilin-type N-terminal cleavage/methylation domain-containing protein